MALTKKQRAELRMKFGGRCAYCGCELGDKWHADHVQPVIRFGGQMLHRSETTSTTWFLHVIRAIFTSTAIA